jgi:NTE family protein
MASTCVPGIFVPVEIGGRILVDGGIVENIPLSCLKSCQVDYKIGVDLVTTQSYRKPSNVIEILYNSFNFLVKTNKKIQTKEADILIKPNLSKFNAVDMSQMKDLIKIGYEETRRIIKNL